MMTSPHDISPNEPLVSIIVPVFNVEDYLVLSVDSLRRQTLSAIEIVCVDDGSFDQSPALLEMLAAVDPRVRIVTKPNGGLSSARNAGLAVARGRFLCFLDADDLLVPEACETIAAAFLATDADVLVYGAHIYPELRTEPWLEATLSPRDIVYDGFDPAILFTEPSTPFAWRTAITRDFFERTRLTFDEFIPFGEDVVFQFNAYPLASRVAFIADKLVEYRIFRPGSLMHAHIGDHVYRLHEHIEIVSAVVRNWRAMGILERYGDDIAAWALDFVGHDIAECDEPDRSGLALHARRAFLGALDRRHWPAAATADPRNAQALVGLYDDPDGVDRAAMAPPRQSRARAYPQWLNRPRRALAPAYRKMRQTIEELTARPAPEDPLEIALNAWDLDDMKRRIAAVRALEREATPLLAPHDDER